MLTRSIKAMIILIEAAAFGYFVAPNFILSNPPYMGKAHLSIGHCFNSVARKKQQDDLPLQINNVM